MFLALKEIRKEKLRSGLIISMIVLISYLIFILTSLALGLARENTDAIDSWGIQNITLDANANVDMRQSLLTAPQVGTLTDKEAYIGQASVVAKATGHERISSVFIGLDSHQFVAKKIKLTTGHMPQTNHEVVVDTSFQESGYQLGDTFKLNADNTNYKIVGFTKNAKMNVAPVIYGQLSTWSSLKGTSSSTIASAIVSKNINYRTSSHALKTYSISKFINKMPGYQAQNLTFGLMIGFLMGISLIVIAVFLYILTMQKLPNYAVLRAQGIPSKILVGATVSQSLILVLSGLVISSILTIITAISMPSAVPMAFDIPILIVVGVGLMIMSLIGGLIPVRSVLRVDPISVIGG
ncbi:ABC superfamily ATP binding cassette transporter, membrane protein [Paucilactobacillus oligofermentans DSM 15707 = LMG 22743]|uniref:Putative hemin transport system permease protein HrtB n=1 Tax=Paucilactobacillus oligofermentans DSM 15707 = LMG 22743 TaxID=1423778 RepID=A0A0R1RF73_9LACO|nr:ABC transporter permease [Paucilactobacillus oligofermentans]KRL55645.1 ABC superfamily ATP binding cassette transporter, membrane protein [Paucilactobacillus oligofermentans DSM 15707 = LMG 22743]CUS25366.1 ABC-type drug resistence protein [Paucilactobacillus oligofermentans DSM 15707 = LMG 22743]